MMTGGALTLYRQLLREARRMPTANRRRFVEHRVCVRAIIL